MFPLVTELLNRNSRLWSIHLTCRGHQCPRQQNSVPLIRFSSGRKKLSLGAFAVDCGSHGKPALSLPTLGIWVCHLTLSWLGFRLGLKLYFCIFFTLKIANCPDSYFLLVKKINVFRSPSSKIIQLSIMS